MLIEQCPFISIRSRLGKFLYSKYATCVSTPSFSECKNDDYKWDKDSISGELSRIDFQRDWIVAAAADVEETEEMFLNYFLRWNMKDGSYSFQGKSWFCDHTHPCIQSQPFKIQEPTKESHREMCRQKAQIQFLFSSTIICHIDDAGVN